MRHKIFTILFSIACIAILFASSFPIRTSKITILYWDKAAHLLAFCVLAFLCFNMLIESGILRRTIFGSIIIVSFYGIIIEAYQYLIPGRQCSFWDWIADLIGAVVGAILTGKIGFLRKRPGFKTDHNGS